MEIVRGRSPDVVGKEILMHFLACDLIRALLWQAGREHNRPLHRPSCAGTMQHFQVIAPYLCLFAGTAQGVTMYRLPLSWVASHVVPYRPHRVEPRAVKRRPKPDDPLTRLRNEVRAPVKVNR